MANSDNVGSIIPIGDGTLYRLYCYSVTSHTSYWMLQVFKRNSFLWLKWENWTEFEFTTNYGAGDTYHTVQLKRKKETDEELVWQAESELDYLGLDYE